MGLVLSVAVVPALSVADLVRGQRRLPWVRIWLLCVSILATEAAALFAAAALTIRYVRRIDRPISQAAHHRLERWWAKSHSANLRRFTGLDYEVENPEETHKGNAIVLARHASYVDAILPIVVFGIRGGLDLHYTLKESLLWAPAMDIVGNRLPNVFVDRSPGSDSPMIPRLEALAAGVNERSLTVIFPEGTFYTPELLTRAAARLGQTRPDLEESALRLRYLLPPRPAGTLALLRGAPDADVIIVGHVGIEDLASLRDIAQHIPLTAPVQVRIWRFERAKVPTDEHEMVTWLLERWHEMDDWSHDRVLDRAQP